MLSINFFSVKSRKQILMMLKNENISKSSLHFQKRFLVNIIISLIWTCLWTGLSPSARHLTLGSQVESDQSVSGHTESQSALGQRGDKMFFSHNPLRRSLNDHAFLPQQRQLPGKELTFNLNFWVFSWIEEVFIFDGLCENFANKYALKCNSSTNALELCRANFIPTLLSLLSK